VHSRQGAARATAARQRAQCIAQAKQSRAIACPQAGEAARSAHLQVAQDLYFLAQGADVLLALAVLEDELDGLRRASPA
jgi:hypothetical protein